MSFRVSPDVAAPEQQSGAIALADLPSSEQGKVATPVRIAQPPSFQVVSVRPGTISLRSRNFVRRELAVDVSHCVSSFFQIPEVNGVEVCWRKATVTVSFQEGRRSRKAASKVLRRLAEELRRDVENPDRPIPEDVFVVHADLLTTRWERRPGHAIRWVLAHSLPGRIRLKSEALESNTHLAAALEQELVSLPGVDSFSVSPLTGSVLVKYDARLLSPKRLLMRLRTISEQNRVFHAPHRVDYDFPLNSVCLPLALATELAAPAVGPFMGLLVIGANRPTLEGAYQKTFREKKLGCDFLDTIVLFGCLATNHIFGMALIGFCLSLGRQLLKKTKEDSQKLLKSAFSKQPRFAWQIVDGQEVEVTVDALKPGDLIAVHAGDMLPVDGEVLSGLGLVDQHTLTGEAAPVEKTKGDEVFATTMLISGEIKVTVQKAGSETTSAKIGEILENTAAYKLTSQSRGEELSDRAVLPTLAIGGAGFATLGLPGGVAVLNSECGTAIRMAAPLGVLSSLTLCATKGILVKDGRALEGIHEVDTVLFDKTGTLTREVPEVCGLHSCNGVPGDELVRYAAIAEQRFTHPIAQAILDEASARNLTIDTPESSDYRIGFGVQVQTGGVTVRVGSGRYMESEGLKVPGKLTQRLKDCGKFGHTMVMVALDNEVAGGIELRATSRPEAFEAIEKLRKLGIRDMAVISGDRREPTRYLAESLGLDRFFAEVLPQDKSSYVKKLQSEGRKVCFIGDGVNDAIALKTADVSISLRGASAIATDSAQVVLLEESLARVPELFEISKMLQQNVRRSWHMIVAPNVLCVLGVFTMGFSVFHSVLTNNVAALAALANGMLPLQRASRIRNQKDLDADCLYLRTKLQADPALHTK